MTLGTLIRRQIMAAANFIKDPIDKYRGVQHPTMGMRVSPDNVYKIEDGNKTMYLDTKMPTTLHPANA